MTAKKHEVSARESIAKSLLMIAGVGILLISLVVLVGAAMGDPKQFPEASALVFNSLLPLFGTWVGTVVAYYFSKANFEAASKSVQNLVEMTTEQRLAQLKVRDTMLPSQKVVTVVSAGADGDQAVRVKTILERLTPGVTRLPVLGENGAVKYLLHQSLIYQFIAERAMDRATAPDRPSLDELTLADLIGHKDKRAPATAIAWVALGATVAEAKAEMERIPRCQDVFVTQGGNPREPMLGWLLNVDIGRLSKA
ncbi:MAG: hypothetical protein JW751_21690 [Polyangiaceae bacterium]|nr:hypothetical protein [Polyangiaceae bacterium]